MSNLATKLNVIIDTRHLAGGKRIELLNLLPGADLKFDTTIGTKFVRIIFQTDGKIRVILKRYADDEKPEEFQEDYFLCEIDPNSGRTVELLINEKDEQGNDQPNEWVGIHPRLVPTKLEILSKALRLFNLGKS